MNRGLIVNADDFGQSAGINRGIVEAYERGIVTSVSIMVRWPAASEAGAYARAQRGLDAGLHVDIGEWIWRDGTWQPLYERVDRTDGRAVEAELRHQLETFCSLLGRQPTHVDSHQHVHCREPIKSILASIAGDIGAPLRHFTPAVRYEGSFYGQDVRGDPLVDLISPSALVSLIRAIPEGVTELSCHPGYADDLDSMYRAERAVEIRALCSEEVRHAILEENIRLTSFADLRVS